MHSHRHSSGATEAAPPTSGSVIRWAHYYDPLVSVLSLGRRGKLRRATVAMAGLQAGESVLEVGCGTGDVALAASAQVGRLGRVAGIDAAPEMIAVARGKARRRGAAVEFRVGLIEALDFPDAHFDVVLSSLMMHHLPAELKRQGLAEIARVLKPGGRLAIVDLKRPEGRWGRALMASMLHGHMGSGVQDLPAMLRAAGFINIEFGEIGFRTLGFVRGQIAS